MKKYRLILCYAELWIVCLVFCIETSSAQKPAAREKPDSIAFVPQPPKRFFGTLGTISGINLGVWSFDRYVKKRDYAYISRQTVIDNFSRGFTWDNDQVSTNFFGHPYHGSMFYNTARANGYGHAAAFAFTAAGSLNWEMFMENEYPSINDIFATTAGGMALGEVFFRAADMLTDDRTTGGQRCAREAVAFVINPARGLTRMLDGSMWKTRNVRGQLFDDSDLFVCISSGVKITELRDRISDKGFGVIADIDAEYGERLDTEGTKPYDYFVVKGSFNIRKGQPFLGRINLSARIWGKDLIDSENNYLGVGMFQHFDYYDSEVISDVSDRVPYRFGAPASFGIGLIHNNRRLKRPNISSFAHLNGLILGASLSDHYVFKDRNYNLGDGFGLRAGVTAEFGEKIALSAEHKGFCLFTLKGYPKGLDLRQIDKKDMDFQGDKSNTLLNISTMTLKLKLTPHFALCNEYSVYRRVTRYRDFENVRSLSSELRMLLGYTF